MAEARGIPTRCDFFGRELAQELIAEGLRPDVVHANNVLAHVPDLNGFVAGIAELLGAGGGRGVIEVPYVKDLLDGVEFDTIYHEHLCYFSLTALDELFPRHGLVVEASSGSRSTAARCACSRPGRIAERPGPSSC